MIAADTSVLVAAFASWHESHQVARAAVASGVSLLAHAALETYSVLTRLPPPHRAPPDAVQRYLRDSFGREWLHLSGAAYRDLMGRLSHDGLRGGAVYDALIAVTAAEHQATLLTLDARAAATYALLGVSFRPPGNRDHKQGPQ